MDAKYEVLEEWMGFKAGEILTYCPSEGVVATPSQVKAATHNDVAKAVATKILRRLP